jgi:hypothetical protein
MYRLLFYRWVPIKPFRCAADDARPSGILVPYILSLVVHPVWCMFDVLPAPPPAATDWEEHFLASQSLFFITNILHDI